MEEQSTIGIEVLSNENSYFSENVNDSYENDRSLDDFQIDVGDIIDRLEIDDLTELRKYFFDKVRDETIKEPKGSAHPRFCGFKLTRNEFISATEKVIGNNAYSDSANNLFDEINKNNSEDHQGFIWWEQILDAVIEQEEKRQHERAWSVIREPLSQLHLLSHCKREIIIRVVPIETQTSFCYVMVSKYGCVGIYDWKIMLLEQYEVKLGVQDVESKKTTWLTDAVYLPDASTLLLSASDRSLHFFTATGLVHVPIYHISGLQNIPTCMHYTVGPTSDYPSVLMIGDDHGGITTIKFHQPEFCLFQRNSTNKMDRYFWKELEDQGEWVTTNVELEVHKDEVIKLEYMPENQNIVSCSNDPHASLVIRHVAGRRAPYIFKISRGVRCYHLDQVLKLLVTGSKDSVVRLWNPVMTNKPIASLFGHKSALVDVRILRNLNAVISMSKDATLKVWDITDECCIQSLPTLFPVHGGTGRIAEFGLQTFYPGPVSMEPPSEKNKKPSHTPPAQKTHPASLLSGTSATKHERTSGSNKSDSLPSTNNEILEQNPSLSNDEIINETDEKISEVLYEEPDVEEESFCEAQWNRMELLAVCCNFVVLLHLGDGDILEGEDFIDTEPLPPPLREQDPAVPSPWLTADPPSNLVTGSHSLLSSGSHLTSPIATPRLEYIRKSIGEDLQYEFRPVTSPKHALKMAKAQKYASQKRVRVLVEQCAPHLALNLSQLEEIKFAPMLPIPTAMRNMDLSNPEDLLKVKIKSDSVSSVISKPSHASSFSTSRSSKINK